ncbi:MAG: CvpA family protein [Lachnospiraceae bacterium]|nr:CvpA family protein [Lachnospiraceae bacterium]
MEINILFVIVVCILTVGAVWGWKRGLLESVIRMISCILGILVIVVIAKGVGSFVQKSYVQVVMALFLLAAIRFIHKVVKLFTDSFKLVRAIPVGRLADKLAGAVLGIAEAVLIVWLSFLLIGIFDFMGMNGWMTNQISQSRFLTLLNYWMMELLKQLL